MRGISHDERDPIGPSGATEWRCELSFGDPPSFTEVVTVRAATAEGAVLLVRESRVEDTLHGVDVRQYGDTKGTE